MGGGGGAEGGDALSHLRLLVRKIVWIQKLLVVQLSNSATPRKYGLKDGGHVKLRNEAKFRFGEKSGYQNDMQNI